jgi:Cof subfamily protein (haloacid dehalogenase superfamily)
MTTDWPGSGVRAVALDIDGTLARSDHQVSYRTVLAVRRLAELGVAPILVTGRTERAARRLSDRIGLSTPVISCNGAVITDVTDGSRLACSHLAPALVRQALDFAAEAGLDAIVWTADEMVAPWRSDSTDLLEDVNQERVVIAAIDQSRIDRAVKMMLAGPRATLDSLQPRMVQRLPYMRRSMDRFYESCTPGATKKDALEVVLAAIGVPKMNCMGFADGDTDAEWLADIGTAVAVSNARDSVKRVASIHIGDHNDDAVAEFIERGIKALEDPSRR